MKKECLDLIKEIKGSVPGSDNLCSTIDDVEKFVYVQELIITLSEFGTEDPFSNIVQSFKDFFHPKLMSTVSLETDFIKVVEPILRYPSLSIHAAEVTETRLQLAKPFSYHAILNKLIEPTQVEIQVGKLLFLHSNHSNTSFKQTEALKIIFGD